MKHWQGSTETVAHALQVGMHPGIILWKAILQKCDQDLLKFHHPELILKNLPSDLIVLLLQASM